MPTKYNKDLVEKLRLEDVLLDTLPNPVYYKDHQGRFVRCNSCFAKLIQKEKKDIIGKLAYTFFPKEVSKRHKEIDKKIIQTLGTNVDEIMYIAPDGIIKYLTLNKAVFLNDDGQVGGIVCVMNDITERIKEEEFMVQQSKLAEMGEMIASIAHQWQEPLVELSALVQKLELFYKMDKLDLVQMQSFVKSSMRQIQYMSETLRDFRNFLKPSQEKHRFDVKKAMREIFEIVGRQIFYFNIHVTFNYFPQNQKIYAYGYENELKQVLLNIINNAKNKIIKKQKEQSFSALLAIRVYEKQEHILIEVQDNAGAIEESILERVFEPFFTTKVDGTGFGLYMAKFIIEEKMQGGICVRNEADNVIFSLKLPKDEL